MAREEPLPPAERDEPGSEPQDAVEARRAAEAHAPEPEARAAEASPGASASLPVPRVPSEVAPAEGSADALTRYMAELRRHGPISREEEHELAVRWYEARDPDAGMRLVLSNLRLVVKIAMEYRRAWTNTLDLVQEGNLGLLQAVERFDPYQGTKLSSYAAYWIRAYILKHLIDNIRLVRLGTSRAQRKLFFRLNREKRELERLGFEPAPKLLAERLDVSEEDVTDMERRLAEGELSLNAPVRQEEGSASFGDFLPAAGDSAEEQVGDEQLRRTFMEHVHAFAAGLDPRERRIVEERILADEPKTLQELGEEFQVSRERVRQLEARLVARLRDYLKEKVVDFEYYGPGE